MSINNIIKHKIFFSSKNMTRLNIKIDNYTIKTIKYPFFSQGNIDLFKQDQFDFKFKYLIIINNKTKKIISSCRYNLINSTSDSNANNYFDLNQFILVQKNIMEIGKVFAKNYKGLYLLGYGILNLSKNNKIDILYGITSIFGKNVENIYLKLKYQNKIIEKNNVKALKPLILNQTKIKLDIKIPSPMSEYIKYFDCYFINLPSLDNILNCYDFFTVINIQNLETYYARKY